MNGSQTPSTELFTELLNFGFAGFSVPADQNHQILVQNITPTAPTEFFLGDFTSQVSIIHALRVLSDSQALSGPCLRYVSYCSF